MYDFHFLIFSSDYQWGALPWIFIICKNKSASGWHVPCNIVSFFFWRCTIVSCVAAVAGKITVLPVSLLFLNKLFSVKFLAFSCHLTSFVVVVTVVAVADILLFVLLIFCCLIFLFLNFCNVKGLNFFIFIFLQCISSVTKKLQQFWLWLWSEAFKIPK